MKEAAFRVNDRRMMGDLVKENPKTVWVTIPEKIVAYRLNYFPKMNVIKRHKTKHNVRIIS
jgi:hypothetical protein